MKNYKITIVFEDGILCFNVEAKSTEEAYDKAKHKIDENNKKYKYYKIERNKNGIK